MHLPLLRLQDMPCRKRVLIYLEFIICFIEIACLSLLLSDLDPLLCKNFKYLSGIYVRTEAIEFDECPSLREITYHLQIIFSDRYG